MSLPVIRLLLIYLCLLPLRVSAQPTDFPALNPTATTTLLIYGAFDLELAQPLVHAFQQQHPTIAIRYHDLNTGVLYNRVLTETQHGGFTADLLLSSAMDLQIKLVNDGYARVHRSSYTAQLPTWAVWRNEVFGFSFEPIVMAYHCDQVPAADVPTNRYDLVELLSREPARYFGKVGVFDPDLSGAGYLFMTQDAQQSDVIWRLAQQFGETGVRLYGNTREILDRIATGDLLIGYNLIGSYAGANAKLHPAICLILPSDYTLVLSRSAVIPRQAHQAELAGLFVDFLLSPEGQQLLTATPGVYAIRSRDGELVPNTALQTTAGLLRPIPLGPQLLVYLDPLKRRKFLYRWQSAVKGATWSWGLDY